jgi:hypothetical protein
MPTPAPGAYAAPTTLGGANAQLIPTPAPGRRSKAPIIIAVSVVLLGGIIAIAVVTKKDKPATTEDPVATASGSDPVKPPPPPDPKPVVKPPPEKPVTVPPDAQVIEPPPKPTIATITLTTTPAGAKILVNGVPIDAVTPQPFDLPISSKPVKIVLQLDGYKDIVLDKLVPNQNINEEKRFEKKAKSTWTPPVTPPGKGSNNNTQQTPPGKGSGKGDDTGLKRPGD